MNKNIVIGRIGLAINFQSLIEGKKNPKFSEIVYLYTILAQYNPDFNFYLIGPSDLNKLTEEEYNTIFPYHNVHSAWHNKINKTYNYYEITDYFKNNNINIDFALMEVCGSNKFSIPGLVPKKNNTPRSLLLVHKMYMGPYVYTLNHLGCPVYVMSDDIRNVLLNFSDLYNRERLVFTQTNIVLPTVEHIQSETDFNMSVDNINCIYARIERATLIGLPNTWKKSINIDKKLNSPNKYHVMVISNGYGTKRINSNQTVKDLRFNGYNEYIIENFKGTPYEGSKIYGKWSDEMFEKYPDIFDDTFPFVLLKNEIDQAKYSLVYSQLDNFVTIKPWELIILGIIPFIHPKYDEQRLLGLPEYVYLKNPEDFKNKVIELDANKDLYLNILNQCFDSIKEEDLNGSYINNFIFSKIGENMNFKYEPKNNVELKFKRKQNYE